MDIGISTLVFSGFGKRDPDLYKALTEIKAAGYKCIEYNDQSVPHPHEIEKAELKKVLELLNKLELKVNSIHVPEVGEGDFGSFDKNVREKAIETAKRTIDTASALKARFLIVHICVPGDVTAGAETLKKVKENNIVCLKELAGYSDKKGVQLALENGGPLGGIVDLLEIISVIGNKSGVCIDTGHALTDGKQPGEMLRKAGKNLLTLHIHDNDGSDDQHLVPGEGSILWKDVMNALKEVGYRNEFVLECCFSKESNIAGEIIKKAMKVSKELLRNQP